MKKGIFITFEGGEGVGKSTQVKLFTEYLVKKKIPFIFTREPGGIIQCEEIRNILLHSNCNLSIEAEALLFSASRAEHINKVILPALSEGKIVICDRFFDSSFAYQGYARGLGFDKIEKLTDVACGSLKPDLTFLLMMDPELAFKRKGGADQTDRIETAGLDFHKKVNEGYLLTYKKFNKRIKLINADDTIESVNKQIINLFESYIKNKK